MTRLEAFETAMAEIDKFGYNVWTQEIKIPEPGDLPDGAFFAFYENPYTGEGFCRTYIFDMEEGKTVSFVKIKNYEEWKEKYPVLTERYLANGVYLYRNSKTSRKIKKNEEENIITLIFSKELDKIPV